MEDFDMKACERMFLRLIDVHRFGDWRIFLDEAPDEKSELSYDVETTPPWIIHREAYDAFHATGEIVQTECGYTEFTLRGPIPSGSHWFVLQGRLKDSPNLIRVRRRVKVV